jgi:trans-aconitate methyltransferase
VEKFLRIPNADITGLDVSEQLLEKARENSPVCRFTHFDGQNIDDEDNSYHLVFAINVFHNITIKNWMKFLMEMQRVLQSDEILALFEHNPWHPIVRFVVSRCSFDSDAVFLSRSNTCSLLLTAGSHSIDSSYMIFLPWSIGINHVLERALGWLTLGVQYFATGIK